MKKNTKATRSYGKRASDPRVTFKDAAIIVGYFPIAEGTKVKDFKYICECPTCSKHIYTSYENLQALKGSKDILSCRNCTPTNTHGYLNKVRFADELSTKMQDTIKYLPKELLTEFIPTSIKMDKPVAGTIPSTPVVVQEIKKIQNTNNEFDCISQINDWAFEKIQDYFKNDFYLICELLTHSSDRMFQGECLYCDELYEISLNSILLRHNNNVPGVCMDCVHDREIKIPRIHNQLREIALLRNSESKPSHIERIEKAIKSFKILESVSPIKKEEQVIEPESNPEPVQKQVNEIISSSGTFIGTITYNEKPVDGWIQKILNDDDFKKEFKEKFLEKVTTEMAIKFVEHQLRG